MKSFDPNVPPPFSFTYAQIAGRDGLEPHQELEAQALGWPVMTVKGRRVLLSVGWAGREGDFEYDICPFDLKMKICDAATARRNFPLPEEGDMWAHLKGGSK